MLEYKYRKNAVKGLWHIALEAYREDTGLQKGSTCVSTTNCHPAQDSQHVMETIIKLTL